jgi:NTP pyrophosphatase (non-canonical NTP hydrolase)
VPVESAPVYNLETVIVPAWSEGSVFGHCHYPPLTLGDLLDSLVEECAEVILATQKIKRFGWSREYASYGRNDDALASELGDVLALLNTIPVDQEKLHIARQEKLRNIASHKKGLLDEQTRTADQARTAAGADVHLRPRRNPTE